VRGATEGLRGDIAESGSFNPRARAGRDAEIIGNIHDNPVSIHAPVRGATPPLIVGLPLAYRFNPRARAGRDIGGRGGHWVKEKFQSTRPCGARRLPSH